MAGLSPAEVQAFLEKGYHGEQRCMADPGELESMNECALPPLPSLGRLRPPRSLAAELHHAQGLRRPFRRPYERQPNRPRRARPDVHLQRRDPLQVPTYPHDTVERTWFPGDASGL